MRLQHPQLNDIRIALSDASAIAASAAFGHLMRMGHELSQFADRNCNINTSCVHCLRSRCNNMLSAICSLVCSTIGAALLLLLLLLPLLPLLQ